MKSRCFTKYSWKIAYSLSLTTVVTILGMAPQKAQAYLFVASTDNNQIVNFDPSTGAITDAFTPGKSSILRYDDAGNFIDVFIPAGTAKNNISVATGIVFGPDNNLYATDFANNSVKRFNGTTGAYIDDFITAGSGGLFRPEDLIFDNNKVYVSQLEGGGVKVYDATTGDFLNSIATTVPGTNTSLAAAVMTLDSSGKLYIGSVFNDSRVLRYDPTNGNLDTFIPPGKAQPVPGGMTFGADGNFYNGNFLPKFVIPGSINKYDGTTGEFLDDFVPADPNSSLSETARLVFGPDGNLYASSFGSNEVFRYNGQTGEFIDKFIPNDSSNGGLRNPAGLAFFTPVPEPSYGLGMLGFASCLVVHSALKSKRRLSQAKFKQGS